jgi:hypothetical protein
MANTSNKQTIGGLVHTPSADYTIYETKDFSIFNLLANNRSTEKNKANLKALKKSLGRKQLFNVIIVNALMEIIDGQHRVKVYSEAYEDVPYDDRPKLYYVICEDYGLDECRVLNQAGKNWDGYDFLHSFASSGLKSYITFRDFMDKYEFMDYWITLRVLSGTINKSTRANANQKNGTDTGDINEKFREGKLIVKQQDLKYAELLAERIQEIVENKWYDGDKVSRTFIVTFSRMMAQPNFDYEVFKTKMRSCGKAIQDVQKMDTIAQQIEKIYNKKEPKASRIKVVATVKSHR